MWLLSLLVLAGCGQEADPRQKLIGPWRMAMKEGVHMVLVFRSGGGWILESSTEDIYTRLAKKIELAEGEWALENDGERLVLKCEKDIPEIGWENGFIPFDIERVDDAFLSFTDPEGRTYEWKRISASDDGNDYGSKTAENTVPLRFDPFVVNLKQDALYDRYKWLCAKVTAHVAESVVPEKIHPKIRERVLIFFSAQRYIEVNTQQEVRELEGALFELLTPYFDGKLSSVSIDKFIVTGNEVAVKRFLESDGES
ncbi:MAG: flagellar basal body-associated FliL family protein [Thermodesulfobacteriota bacterium]|nr:flagellar basal body-associated FliL family protein [Thermodesulfobacteriota bacterium]